MELTHAELYAIDNLKELVQNYGPDILLAITKLMATVKEQEAEIKRLKKELSLYGISQ